MFRTYSRFPVKKAAALTLSLLFLLPLSACSKEEPVQWDPLWVEEFDLSEEEQALYRSLLEPVDVTQTCGDVKLHIGQTVSDGNHLYLPLTVILPESVSLTDYPCLLGEEPSASPHIEGLDLRQNPVSSSMHSACPLDYTYSSHPDLESNSILFLLSLGCPDGVFSDQDLTLTFETIQINDGETDTVLLEGSYAISWDTGPHNEVIERTILNDAGEPVGTLALSPLGLWTDVYCPDAASVGPFHRLPVALYGADGQRIQRGAGYTGSYGGSTFEGHWRFFSPLDTASVAKIEIGGYEVTL